MGMGCKPAVTDPCKSKNYKPTSDNTITAVTVIDNTKESEKKVAFFIDFEHFFQINGIEVSSDEKLAIRWVASDDGMGLDNEGKALAVQTDCGWYVLLPKRLYYSMYITVEKNGVYKKFDQADYDSPLACMSQFPGDEEYTRALCVSLSAFLYP